MVRRGIALVLAAALGTVGLAGCAGDGPGEGSIVVTTNILGDVAQQIVGDEAEVVVLMPDGADPHSFEISARDAATVENAALVVSNGLGLEEGVQNSVDAAAEAGVPVLAVGEEVDPLEYQEGSSRGQADPHFWTDPERMREAARLIAEQVLEQVPDIDAAAVQARAAEYDDELAALDDEMREAFDRIPTDQRTLVTNHHVLGYLADRYGFEVLGAVIPSGTTLASPSAADLDALATAIREAGVPAIFADSSHPDRLAQVLAETAGVDVEVHSLYSESLTADGEAATYLGMMRANTATIATALTP
ncbi:zinc ABC transporter substrate-binding protein [Aeromicrobium phragmitis]|uniref:Zinc ABC transporter substrate-binding protein n=1 Tax=Aeromicrobium phragmitis TaxID=2478914 RepID=A0A3L8PNG3_9ACTN|nr:zinc ABC transporter substrate-binding protein [Aeromicrobium phragmitis]